MSYIGRTLKPGYEWSDLERQYDGPIPDHYFVRSIMPVSEFMQRRMIEARAAVLKAIEFARDARTPGGIWNTPFNIDLANRTIRRCLENYRAAQSGCRGIA